MACLVPVTAAALAIAWTGLAGSPVPAAPRPAKVATLVQAEARVTDPAPAKVRPIPPQVKAAVNTLFSWYWIPEDQLIGGVWWQSAVALSSMEAYQQTTGDRGYQWIYAATDSLKGRASDYENNLDDDTGWWGLVWLNAYTITHNTAYLEYAEDIAAYIHQKWNNTGSCGGGGVPEHRSPEDGLSGAINNELFLELTAWLHNTIIANGGKDSPQNPDSFISWAISEWKYFSNVHVQLFHAEAIPASNGHPSVPAYLVPNSSPVIADGTLCGDDIKFQLYAYNQGVILAALAQMYLATKNSTYLTDAEHIADAVLNARTFPVQINKRLTIQTSFTVNGVLTDPTCQPTLSCGDHGDGGEFKGIFVRDLRTLDDVIASKNTPKTANSGTQCTATYDKKKYTQCTNMYNNFLTTQACSVEANDTLAVTNAPGFLPPLDAMFPADFFGPFWAGPLRPSFFDPADLYDDTPETSGVEALVAADNLPAGGARFPDCRPRRRSSEEPGERSHPAAQPGRRLLGPGLGRLWHRQFFQFFLASRWGGQFSPLFPARRWGDWRQGD